MHFTQVKFTFPMVVTVLAFFFFVYQSFWFPFLLVVAMVATTGLMDKIHGDSGRYRKFEILFRGSLSVGVVVALLDTFFFNIVGSNIIYAILLVILTARIVLEYIFYNSKK
ncbi:hypothetical protein SAMN05421503_1817 [Terribacillus aidingensis]|uniref:Uncharacterized protein n=1 Tax=Terribacillus aidingensis TaxID=586416 RepID=A0A285NNU8_9BACI|nr:hypothetical protein [Terribacillus aidingensis]SNZ10637.1 hypothetical protein SAMN05421503_1817 [Terribacillus aidingensis]